MSFQRPGSRLIPTARPCIEAVWNEDITSHTTGFRFIRSRSHRQYLSSGPGPLEARKRNAKRRLAHIAHHYERGVQCIDPCLLAGTIAAAHSDKWEWQSPSLTLRPEPEASIPLPSWLTDMIHATRQASEKAAQAEREVVRKANTTYREHAFFRAIKGCESVTQIRQNAATLDIDVCKYSPRVFHQLFEISRSLEACLNYLEDFSLGHSENGNLRRLLEWILPEISASRSEDLTQVRKLLADWVRAQLSLGLRSELEISDIITFIDQLATYEESKTMRCDLISALLQGLNSSNVLKPQDLSLATLQRLLGLVSHGELEYNTRIYASKLILDLPSAMTPYPIASVSKFIVGCFKSQAVKTNEEGRWNWQSDLLPKITAIFQDLPGNVAGQIIRSTSRLLIEWQKEESDLICPETSPLNQWWLLLVQKLMPSFEQRGCEDLYLERLMPSDRADMLVSYAQHLGDARKSVFILWNWFADRLPRHRMADILTSLASAIDRKEAPIFVCMLRTVRNGGLLDDDFLWHVFRLLRNMHMYNTMTQTLIECRSICLHLPPRVVQYAIPQILASSPSSFGRIFRHDRQLLLDTWPEAAEHVIGMPNQHPNTAWHHIQIRDTQRHATAFNQEKESFRHASAQMLETLASTYAEATHLTSRMALRQVHRCYLLYKHGNFGPLTSNLTRAIVHAALIRPLQERQGVSTAVIKWVLTLIRQIEGSACADEIDHMLFWWRKAIRRRVDNDSTIGKNLLSNEDISPVSVPWRYKTTRRHNHADNGSTSGKENKGMGVVPIRCIYGERVVRIRRPMLDTK